MENWHVFKSIKIEKVIFIITSPRASFLYAHIYFFLYGRERYTVKKTKIICPFFGAKKGQII